MHKKLQVFISSTYLDMREERQAAVEAVLRAGHIPAGMELFASGDKSQWETITRWIDESDVFLLILGGRYGSIESESKKSYIELEYRYAIDQKKPHFAAVIAKEFLDRKVMSSGSSVIETEHGEKFTEFRAAVMSKMSQSFSDQNSLKLIIFQSLADMAKDEKLVGWVRKNEVLDPKATLETMNHLERENRELTERVSALSSKLSSFEPERPRLSSRAKQMLKNAATGNGHIAVIGHSQGYDLRVGGATLASRCQNRDRASWLASIKELKKYGLISDLGGDSHLVEEPGYQLIEQKSFDASSDD